MQISIFIEIDEASTVEQIKAALMTAGVNAAGSLPESRIMGVDEEIHFSMGGTNGYNASVFRAS